MVNTPNLFSRVSLHNLSLTLIPPIISWRSFLHSFVSWKSRTFGSMMSSANYSRMVNNGIISLSLIFIQQIVSCDTDTRALFCVYFNSRNLLFIPCVWMALFVSVIHCEKLFRVPERRSTRKCSKPSADNTIECCAIIVELPFPACCEWMYANNTAALEWAMSSSKMLYKLVVTFVVYIYSSFLFWQRTHSSE